MIIEMKTQQSKNNRKIFFSLVFAIFPIVIYADMIFVRNGESIFGFFSRSLVGPLFILFAPLFGIVGVLFACYAKRKECNKYLTKIALISSIVSIVITIIPSLVLLMLLIA